MDRQRGFTLIEMLIAVAALGLLLGWSMLSFKDVLPAWKLESAATDVANALRATRARAVLQQTTMSVPFDVDRGLYTYSPGINSDGVLRVAELPEGVSFTRPDPGDAITLAPPAAPTDEAAVFAPTGLLSSATIPGAVYLGNSDDALYRKVEVNMAGIVRIQKWDGSTWK